MGFFSSFKSKVSGIASAGLRVVTKVVEVIATKGEAFIGTIKETYQKVKPLLQKLSPYLQTTAKMVMVKYPWLGGAILAADKAITALLALENSEVLKKAEEALRWVIELAKRLHEKLTAAEAAAARMHEEAFREARAKAQTAEQKSALDIAAMINELALVKTGIANLLESGEFTDFEHFLRLRAIQRLIRTVDATLARATSIEEISVDDIFLVQLGTILLSEKPELSDEETVRLDRIVQARCGKKLVPFVFEEMHKMWQLALSGDGERWKHRAQELSVAEAKRNRLKFEAQVSQLSPEEQEQLDALDAMLPHALAENADLLNRNVERERYVYAIEGFLQLLEKSEEELIAADQDYLLDLGPEVGELLMECAQKNLRWTQLTPEQQALIGDFANIFRADSVKRGEMLEIECNG